MNNDVPVSDELYSALIQCFFIIFVGYIGGQFNLLTESHSIGLSRYISNFALPAVIFQNLVNLNFQNVSWSFLCAVLISKTIVFFITMFMSLVAERPRNLAALGQYSIMATQSNDFALILPIIDAVYRQTHPEFNSYIYLIAPISLIILNPIGFVLIEMQKRIDDQRRNRHHSWQTCQLLSTVFRNISRNPIVICTLLGMIFNLIFNQKLPNLIDYILKPISQSFSATALFYLGLTMVGKLNRLHIHLVITVFLLSTMKLIVFPLILRQAIFFLVKPINNSLNVTLDYSNMGFLYGTAPVAPSVIFYVPEGYSGLQAVTSTTLVVSTLLAAPIMLVSAKMISIRGLDVKAVELYETLLNTTAFDVSLISFFSTIVVLIGFCLRRRWFKNAYIHRYTFIFVGLQMMHAFWTIATNYMKPTVSFNYAKMFDTVFILISLTTRTWASILSIILMITICHSAVVAPKYSWFYHLFGWIVPLCFSLWIYLCSPFDRNKEQLTVGVQKFGKLQLILSVIVLSICIIINCVSLLRMARRTYRLRRNMLIHASSNESLIEENDDETPMSTNDNDTQLFRHGLLVTFLTVDGFICLSALLWLLLVRNRDGIYYELQFLDTVLLHGQGIISFLIFALDTEFLVPIFRSTASLLHYFGWNRSTSTEDTILRSLGADESQTVECQIRPEFFRHSSMTQNYDSSHDLVFNGSIFCQWLISNGYVNNELTGKSLIQRLISNRILICVNQKYDSFQMELSACWLAFSK